VTTRRIKNVKKEKMETSEKDRVRDSSPKKINKKTDWKTSENIRYYSGQSPDQIQKRVEALEKEWDIDRVLGLGATIVALAGTALALKNVRWLIAPGIVTGFLLQQAAQGWSPPLPLLRLLGYRARNEIEREKHALQSVLEKYGISGEEKSSEGLKKEEENVPEEEQIEVLIIENILG
jgi:hypothetical protein